MVVTIVLVASSVVIGLAGAEGGLGQTQFFSQEPQQAQEVREGETIKLECRVQNKSGVLQWTKDDFGLGTDRELAGFDRYRMTGDSQAGQYDLEIVDARLEDIGRYQCQVGATDTVAPIRSAYAEVTVVAPPEPPVITAGPRLVLRDGKTAMVQCISKGGRPASTIRWLRAGTEVVDGVETRTEELPDDSRRMATVSTLTFTVDTSMQGVELVCEASNSVRPAGPPELVSTVLEVQYEPRVQLRLEPEVLYEGDKVRLVCRVDAVPAQVEFRWEIGGVERREGRGASELIIEAVSRELNTKTVSCIARNALGQASSQLVLDVKCK